MSYPVFRDPEPPHWPAISVAKIAASYGTLDRLLRSGARFAHSAVVLTAYERGGATRLVTRQLGPAIADQSGRGIGPRTTKDLVEGRLFALRNNLFSELSLVFPDTTSLYFEGAGGHSSANTVIPAR